MSIKTGAYPYFPHPPPGWVDGHFRITVKADCVMPVVSVQCDSSGLKPVWFTWIFTWVLTLYSDWYEHVPLWPWQTESFVWRHDSRRFWGWPCISSGRTLVTRKLSSTYCKCWNSTQPTVSFMVDVSGISSGFMVQVIQAVQNVIQAKPVFHIFLYVVE